VGSNNRIVVGGASGIGLAVARHFAVDGASTTIIDVDAKRVESAARDISAGGGAKVLGLVADVRSSAELAAACDRSASRHGPINSLVVTAGVLRPALLTQMSELEYDLTFDVNTKGFWNCVKAALPHLSPEGSCVVAISSASGQRPKAGNGAYAASKAALQFLVRTFALELAAQQVRVNCVSPSTIETPLIAEYATRPAASGYRPSAPPPIGRLCTPNDIAKAVAFLCSDNAAFITGATLSVDGGLTAGIPLQRASMIAE
jgi:NAD(P)-dependent dehydrogenase (short-subunit alcohol dehydrogenase family)